MLVNQHNLHTYNLYKTYVHAIPSSQITMYIMPLCKIFHSFCYVQAHFCEYLFTKTLKIHKFKGISCKLLIFT